MSRADGAREGDPLMQITGDPAAAALLRTNLTGLAEQHRGTALGRLISEVLAGRRPTRDLETDPEFLDLTRSGVQRYQDYLASLSEEDRRRLSAQAEQLVETDEPGSGARPGSPPRL